MKNTLKFLALAAIVLSAVFLNSCDTEIPPEDTTPPEFTFQISGDGFLHTFNQDTDFHNITLMMRRGITYDFVFSGSDQGGMDRMACYSYHNGNMVFEEAITGSWEIENTDPWNSSVEWVGDPGNPLTGSIIAGSFTTQGTTNDSNFRISMSDYGGETGRPNRVLEDLRVYVGAHNTRIRHD